MTTSRARPLLLLEQPEGPIVRLEAREARRLAGSRVHQVSAHGGETRRGRGAVTDP